MLEHFDILPLIEMAVGPGNGISGIQQGLGERAHADPGDADDMNMACRHRLQDFSGTHASSSSGEHVAVPSLPTTTPAA